MRKKLIYASIVVVCVLLDIVLHVLSTSYSTVPEFLIPSFIASNLGFEITAAIWAVLAFGGAAYVFYKSEHLIPGTKFSKGLRYGLAIGLIWLVAMLEGVSLFGNPVVSEIVVGLGDFIPMVIMGILLGILTSKKENVHVGRKYKNLKDNMITIGVFVFIFTLGRYMVYVTEVVQSGYQTNPFLTAIWTLSMGMAIGVSYILLNLTISDEARLIKSIKFGGWIFGVSWALFLFFMPLLFEGFLSDMLIRTTLDIGLAILSCYVAETIIANTANR